MQYVSIDILKKAAYKIDRKLLVIQRGSNRAYEHKDTELYLMYQKQYVQLNNELQLITDLIDFYENLSDTVY